MLHGTEYHALDVRVEKVFDHVERITADNGRVLGYTVRHNVAYYSRRYRKWVGIEAGDRSDGATGAIDVNSFGWLVHDELCNDGKFEDGAPCTNWQASRVLCDIMKAEGYWFRARSWFWATWAFGGGKARKNGMW